jgi:6-phosphogluconolactonase (cycloisomerase 2 family)
MAAFTDDGKYNKSRDFIDGYVRTGFRICTASTPDANADGWAEICDFIEAQKNVLSGGVDILNQANGVAVSPDGAHVYVTAGGTTSALGVFRRDATGKLTFVEAHRDGVGGVDGLGLASSVAVSPDAKHVYATGRSDSAVATFSRDSATGQLTFVERLTSATFLGGAQSVAVSPDDKHVYVAGIVSDSVSAYSRDATTGKLTFIEQKKDGLGGVDGLDSARSVTVSPDGKHVYAVGAGLDDAVVTFARNATTGQLTFVEALEDGVGGITNMNVPSGVVVSKDEKNVYVTSELDNAVVIYSRNVTTGQLTLLEAEKNGVNDPGDAGGLVDGLLGASALGITPSGGHLYATGASSNALAVFERSSVDGKLSYVTVFKNGVSVGANVIDGLSGASAVVISPDGEHAYVAGTNGNAVAVVFTQ